MRSVPVVSPRVRVVGVDRNARSAPASCEWLAGDGENTARGVVIGVEPDEHVDAGRFDGDLPVNVGIGELGGLDLERDAG